VHNLDENLAAFEIRAPIQ